MPINFPSTGIPFPTFESSNPFLSGMLTGQDITSGFLKQPVQAAEGRYADAQQQLKAVHQDLVNRALPFQYLLQYSKDPAAILNLIRTGKLGDVGNKISNAMTSMGGRSSFIPQPLGNYSDQTQSMQEQPASTEYAKVEDLLPGQQQAPKQKQSYAREALGQASNMAENLRGKPSDVSDTESNWEATTALDGITYRKKNGKWYVKG